MSDQRITDEDLADIQRRADITDSIDHVCDESTMADLRRLLAELRRTRAELAVNAPTCGHGPDWSCRLGPRCACSKIAHHDGRHKCACGSWWYDNA